HYVLSTISFRRGCRTTILPGTQDNMESSKPEVVIVGGGIAGSALATVLAREGIATTVLEKSTVHLDHVRGEWLAPWGVKETERLGLYDTLIAAGAHHVSRHVGFGDDVEPETAIAESMDITAFEGAGYKRPLCMRHPDMCDLLNRAAKEAGADLRRGIHDLQVTSGERPEVRFTQNGAASLLRPRLVIGADGRNSVVRGQVAIPVHRDPTHHLMTGMLVDDVDGWPDSMQVIGSEGDVNFLV